MHSSVELRVLGPIEALRDGRSLAVGGPRQRTLLALLALEPERPVGVGRLVDEIWAAEPPDGADITLRSYVSRLRRTLGSGASITSSSSSYSLHIDPDAIDARRFERVVRDAEAALARRNVRNARDLATTGLAMWRGPAYGDEGTDGALLLEAERLDALRVRATELRLEASLALGEGAALVDELEALVRQHPYRERFWQHLMLALYRADRQADALAAYQRARVQLQEHLGLDPGEELERLQQQILRQEVPPATAPEARHNLPAPLTTFIGRTTELAALAELLDRHRLVTLAGIGGVGKTRLALEAARSRVAEHPDGVFFVDLAPLAEPALLAGHIAEAMEVREQPGVSGIDRLLGHLRTSDALLVLDNCEHLRAASADLSARLLAACPGLRILATSREVLGVSGEADVAVPPLGLPADSATGRDARDSEAVRLFLARAREARPGIADDDETIETIARICADLDGLPLAIELAAARARALSPTEIGSRIRDRFRFLVSWRRLATARHRTLREAMDWSYGLLEPEEQSVLRALSVFVGGFTLAAVAAVATEGDEDRALRCLERLVEASLVAVDSTNEETRYTILETVREYGAEHLEAAGERDEVRRRHAEYFAVFAEAVWHPVRTSAARVQGAWLGRFARDRENLRAALTWQEEASAFEAMLRLTEALWWFWWIRGELTEGRTWLGMALEGATGSDEDLRGLAHLGFGGLSWAHGDLDAAEEHATLAQQLFAAVGNTLQEGSALNTLGVIAYARGQNARSRSFLEASIAKLRTASATDPSLLGRIAIAIDNLGTVSLELGDMDAALAQYQEALELNRARADGEGIAMNEMHIGILEAHSGRLEEARALLDRAFALYASVGFHQYAAECLETASIVANGEDTPEEAAFLLGVATRLRDDASAPPVPIMARIREREADVARSALGLDRFGAITREAVTIPLEAAMQRAQSFLGRARSGS
jgi:predicted ATPase/DNA-binding SARP family transcriptional activator